MNNSSYAMKRTENETQSLISSTDVEAGHASPSDPRNTPTPGFLHTILLSLIFLGLSFLILLCNDILAELRDQRTHLHMPDHLLTPDSLLSTRSGPKQQRGSRDTVVLIVYVPGDEGQLLMASRIADGVRSVPDTIVLLESTATATFDQVLEADGVILGSPVENGNTHPLVQSWINEKWDIRYDLRSKAGGAFVTAGGMSAGEEGTLQSLIRAMLIFRMIVVGGDDWKAAFGASAITAEEPFMAFETASRHQMNFAEACYEESSSSGVVIHPIFLTKAYGLGLRIATIAAKMSADPCV